MSMSRRGLLSRFSRLSRFTLALGATLAFGVASAQTGKTVKLMVGFPPGGGTDAIARILAERLKDELGAAGGGREQARRRRPDRGAGAQGGAGRRQHLLPVA
ncbi:MAG: hypothetical protein V9G10_07495 [Candidatus Nanopelagicales bacterium]